MKFSLIFFSGDERNKYRLVLEAARFADANGFEAIWIPERHFHRFGGLYPNPSVLGAALAMATRRLRIRAGSVILPAHHVVRVAEEWSVVDNLSGGRAGIALATGFSPVDFLFRPDAWSGRREDTFRAVDQLRRFWEGETLRFRDGVGNDVEVELHPRPVQPELPVWLTCTKSRETFVKAGELGCNVLTGLVDMTMEEMEEKLRLYRRTLAENSRDDAPRTVTMMMHAFVGADEEEVRRTVRAPFMEYLKGFFKVIDSQKRALAPGESPEAIPAREREELLNFGFEKFFNKGSLMGTPEKCARIVERVRGIGVDEIACLIDFGVDEDKVLAGLEQLATLKRMYEPGIAAGIPASAGAPAA